MPEAVLSIKHWGNNLGVRLPQSVARAAQLHADQQVRRLGALVDDDPHGKVQQRAQGQCTACSACIHAVCPSSASAPSRLTGMTASRS